MAEQLISGSKREVASEVLAGAGARDRPAAERFRQEAHLVSTPGHQNVLGLRDYHASVRTGPGAPTS